MGRERALVIDADVITRRVLRACLEVDELQVVEAESISRGRALLDTEKFDLITLDIELDADDGVVGGRTLRDAQDAPIIVVSATDDRAVRNAALTEFADDYIIKPFDVHEFVARSRALLRRANGNGRSNGATDLKNGRVSGASELRLSGFKLDLAGHRIIDPHGNPVELSATEFKMLKAFITNPNRVLSREHLLELSGGAGSSETLDRAVDMRVRRLRQKLGHGAPKASDLIQTIRGVGYVFRVPAAMPETPDRADPRTLS